MNHSSSNQEVILRHPPDSRLEASKLGPVVHVPGSSGVALDEALVRIWQLADGRTCAELEEALRIGQADLSTGLTALRAAGLLLPPLDPTPPTPNAPLPDPLPLVSVVIVSRNGKYHLEECLPSLLAQTYPRIEIIVVDDESTDGTAEYLRLHFPMTRIVHQTGGPNFPAGCNRGIEQATGELVLLLNNDTVLDSQCIREMVVAQSGRSNVGGVAAMLRFYNNRPFVNGLGTFIPRHGLGHDIAIGHLDLGQFEHVDQVPLLCFGATLIPRSALEQVGPLDEAYEFYYEDADWGYRARALGLDLIAAPRAKVYHKFGASTGELPSAFKTRLAARNRLRFALKNLPRTEAARQIIFHALEDAARAVACLARGQAGLAGALVRAWGEFIRAAPEILNDRRRAWQGRTHKQVSFPTLSAQLAHPEMQGTHPRLTQALAENRYREHLARWNRDEPYWRLLIISPDSVNMNMGGVGIRYWELANVLAKTTQVTLAVPNETALVPQGFAIQTYKPGDEDTLKPLVSVADIILLSGFIVYHHPFLRDVSKFIIVDLYDPTVLENLERFSARPMDEQNGLHQLGVTAYNELFKLGDFFVCASEKQRDYWLGALSSANRVNPAAYRTDPTLRQLIDVVPFGLPDDPPQYARRVLKGVRPGIGEDDKVIVWGGGLWDWLDPLTAIEAMPAVLRCVPEARLFFMGTRHPNPDVPTSRMAQRAIERATELGLRNHVVFFNDWVPYADRANYLLEADVGVSLHGDHIETRFSIRTRLMDYVWAGLPMVVTGGDMLSDLVATCGLGRVIAPGDVNAVAEGLIEMLQSPVDRAHFAPVIEMFRWSRVAEPLVRYAAAPWRSGKPKASLVASVPVTPVRQLPAKAIVALRERGLAGLARDIRSYLVWRWTRW
jgi:GT2 family glycosyltransferase/glycosyltransferase involved in cell wall biosynthesis